MKPTVTMLQSMLKGRRVYRDAARDQGMDFVLNSREAD